MKYYQVHTAFTDAKNHFPVGHCGRIDVESACLETTGLDFGWDSTIWDGLAWYVLKESITDNCELSPTPFTSLPPTPMSVISDPKSAARRAGLSEDEKALRDAGFIDTCGLWTSSAQTVLFEKLVNDKDNKAFLVKLAKDMLKDRKERGDDCCC